MRKSSVKNPTPRFSSAKQSHCGRCEFTSIADAVSAAFL